MERLWAPWRIRYICAKNPGCIFCKAAKSHHDNKDFVLERGRFGFSVLNLFPYNNGHIMVAPLRHVANLESLKGEEAQDLSRLVISAKQKLEHCLNPDGYNIGLNLGRVAGAGFPGHLHIHIVPRWRGDTNFMSAVADTKVISQSLKELYQKLTNAHPKRTRGSRR
ncbi:MAG: HIT family protein [Candidatus Omnitrophota bacterium]